MIDRTIRRPQDWPQAFLVMLGMNIAPWDGPPGGEGKDAAWLLACLIHPPAMGRWRAPNPLDQGDFR